MGRGKKRARGYTLQRGRRGLAGVGVGVGRAVLKLPCTKFASSYYLHTLRESRFTGRHDPDPVTSLSFLVKQPGGLGYKLHSKCSKTHSRHTQSHADPSRARQARSGPSGPRSLPDPTDPPSEQASTTDHQPVLQPASPAPPARPESRPNPNPMRPFSSPAGRPRSRSSARPRKGGRPPGARATPTHTAHSPTHTHTHSFTHSPRRGEMEGGAGRSQRPVALRKHPGSSQAVPLSVAHRVGAPPP